MAIPVKCKCGKSFELRNEYAGEEVTCPACQAVLKVPAVEDWLAPLLTVVRAPVTPIVDAA
jgi:hypothetical protein